MIFKTKFGLILEKENRGEEEEEEEGKEKKKKNKKEEEEAKFKVWNLTLSMDYLDFLYGYMFVGCGL